MNGVAMERSAGGVVFRKSGDELKLLLILDRFGRWTMPKGLVEPGETSAQAALREIREETGIDGEIVRPLANTSYWYTDDAGRKIHKLVEHFLVRAKSEQINPAQGEIEDAQWVTVDEALARPGYENNKRVIRQAIAVLE